MLVGTEVGDVEMVSPKGPSSAHLRVVGQPGRGCRRIVFFDGPRQSPAAVLKSDPVVVFGLAVAPSAVGFKLPTTVPFLVAVATVLGSGHAHVPPLDGCSGIQPGLQAARSCGAEHSLNRRELRVGSAVHHECTTVGPTKRGGCRS